MQLNEIYFAGFVGQNASEITTQSGSKIVNFSLCHTYKVKNSDKEVSTWVKVKVFGGWCDLANKIKKGDNVFVKGILNISEYEKDGIKKTSVEISANSLSIIKKDMNTTVDNINIPKKDEIRIEDIPF